MNNFFKKTIASSLGALALSMTFCMAQGIPLKVSTSKGLKCSINGLEAKMLIDEHAWYTSLSNGTFFFLYENDYIKDSDIIGTQTMKISDGSTVRAITVKLADLEIMGRHYKDQMAVVISKQVVPVLVGRGSLEGLPEVEWVTPSQQDSLYLGYKDQAIKYFNNKSYVLASDAFASLYEEGQLDQKSIYYYICSLAFSQQWDEFEKVSGKWEADYPDASSDMRMTLAMLHSIGCQQTGDLQGAMNWSRRYVEMYDGGMGGEFTTYFNALVRLGAINNEQGNNTEAIRNYSKAYQECLSFYGKTEKDISSKLFENENTATALYGLGLSYIRNKDTRNGKKYMVLSARCGSEDAKDICKKMYWKY